MNTLKLQSPGKEKNIFFKQCSKNPKISELKWYIFYTYPRAEKVVYQELIQKEYEAFLPLLKIFRVWKNRQKKLVEFPLFPNYIFIKTRCSELFNIKRLPKIATYICCGNTPSSIPEKEIDTIKRMLSLEQEVSVDTNFHEGEKVRIVCGPLIGHEGILIEQKGKTRFGIQLKEINHTVMIDISCSDLERV